MECTGNVQQLCTAKYLSQRDWWSFVQCENSYGRAEIGTPKTARRCATSVGFDWDETGVGGCADVLSGHARDSMNEQDSDELEGVTLLKASVQRSQDLGIE